MNSLFTDLKTETMIDKKQIITDFDKIIGNNQEVTDETHMDLVDECADYTETLVNKLLLTDISQQRELLIDCVDHCYNVDNYKFRTTEDKVDNYIESINCG